MKQALDDKNSLFDAVDAHPTPLSVGLPNMIHENRDNFMDVARELNVRIRLFGAHKATYSPSLVATLLGHGGVDVASSWELRNAVACGFEPSDIIATGPKTTSFLRDLVQEHATIIVDSPEELDRLTTVCTGGVSALLRLTRTMINDQTITKRSRFGMDQAGFTDALTILNRHPQITLRGIAFHLDSQSITERVTAIRKAMDCLIDLQSQFPSATVLDIGGGYGANYGLSYEQAQLFENTLKRAHKTGGSMHTWQGFSYGLDARAQLQGVELPAELSGADRLRAVLASTDSDGHMLAEMVNENLIELWIEPGASLFHDAGFVVAEVIEVRQLDDHQVVLVDAHRNQICFENNEVLSDPLLIQRTPQEIKKTECVLLGHLCAESDLLSYRHIVFDTMPMAGDLLVWTHTGAYRSHFSTSTAIGHTSPTKLVYRHKTTIYEPEYES